MPIVLGGAGEVLDVGRQCRLANRAQRRALRAMYRTCAHPDCTVPFDSCRIHHVIYWERGGPSDLDNMLPLCERHHHLVHEGGWTLQLFPDRRTTWRTPDGTVYFDGITTDRGVGTDDPVDGDGATVAAPRRSDRRAADGSQRRRRAPDMPSPRSPAGRRRSDSGAADGRERIARVSDATDLTQCTATNLLELYRRREASPVEVTAAVLDRIERLNPVLNCFALVAGDEALAAARASEARWQVGRAGRARSTACRCRSRT